VIDSSRLSTAYRHVRDTLLARRHVDGYWVGELSSSALSTATAIVALKLLNLRRDLVASGLKWLADHQNSDGGWGDTTLSVSNVSTTMLGRSAMRVCDPEGDHQATFLKAERWLFERYGNTPEALAEAVRARYGNDRTFAVPILTMTALAGLCPWREVPRLPFELACLPQSWYRFARLPVVSYALPALIAIGQCAHHHRGTWNPVANLLRAASRTRSLKVLERIQPSNGGFLEATPLTSFVVMSLASIGLNPTNNDVVRRGAGFIVDSARPDGSWPIDTNLSVWVTTLAVNALAAADDLSSLDQHEELIAWLLARQMTTRHPYTGSPPGGWGWSHLPGSVPDCDDTPGAVLALRNFRADAGPPVASAVRWIRGLQNRDGGFPTFCRGWGALPFDRSGSDLTAHALRAIGEPDSRALAYLARHQRADGSWLPLWFGNQHAPDDINPVYGTSRVLAAYRDLNLGDTEPARRGVDFLLSVHNADGGWGGAAGIGSSTEETALATEVLLSFGEAPRQAALKGAEWLVERVEAGTIDQPAPIGFYFAKLWYFEKLYPLIFATAALGRAKQVVHNTKLTNAPG
jgi:squalene-hopene/tetraprenyl-beta-curcumene cyclase